LFIILLPLLIIACSSNKTIVRKADGNFPTKPVNSFVSNDFWMAMQNIDCDYLKEHPATFKKPIKKDISSPNFFGLAYLTVRVSNDVGRELLFGLDFGANKTPITDNVFKKNQE
jgi:hypothetical protein